MSKEKGRKFDCVMKGLEDGTQNMNRIKLKRCKIATTNIA